MTQKLSFLILGLFLSFSIINAQYTLTDADVTVTDGVITLCSYDFTQTDIIIPSTLDGQTVTGIGLDVFVGSGVFEGKGITSVQLPAGLQTIGVRAFRSNSLASVDLSSCPALQTIGESAFQLNSISNVDLSASTSLEIIGNNSFSGNLISVLDLSSCNALQSIEYNAFMENSITSLNLNSCTSLQTIGNQAFYDNNIATLDLSPCTALQSVGNQAFRINSITTVELSTCPLLQYIGNAAFYDNSLTGFTLPSPVISGYFFEHWYDAAENTYAGNESVSDLATSYSALQLYILKDDDVVVSSGEIISCSYDFSHTDIIIPSSLDGQTVTGIGNNVFQNKGISYLRIPGSLQIIRDYAFSYNLIPDLDLSSCTSLHTIEYRAFNVNALTSIDLSACTALQNIGELAFYGNSIPEFTLPTPVISGYIFQHWEDGDGEIHPGNSTVSDFRTSYTAVLVLPSLPAVSTQAVTNITGTSATCNGTITDLGAPDPTQHGFCWNTTGTPGITDQITEEGAVAATGAFTSEIAGLSECTTYYVRAYATNSEGTVYGGETSFTTNDETKPVPDIENLSDVTAECEVSTLSAPTATDNCVGSITGTHDASLPINAQGTTVVTWTYDDGNGNSSTQTQNIVIDDISSPVPDAATLSDISAECEVSALSAPTATDNCVGSITGTHDASLPITTQGTTVVTWTFDDGNGNTSTQTQHVVIDDISGPVPNAATLSDISAECEVSALSAPTATDNCAGAIAGTHDASLPITAQGTSVVTWTFDDGNGNSSTQTQNVVIKDITDPTISCVASQEINIEAEESYYIINGTEFDPLEFSDNCAVASVINDLNNASSLAGAELPLGTTSITWTITDEAGNIGTCSFIAVIDQNTEVNNTTAKAGFTIYPNPAEDYIVISGKTILHAHKIEIVDITGKVVKLIVPETGKNEFTIHIEDMQKGLYFIKADNKTVAFSKR